MPVILGTQVAEIRRITVPSQTGQIVCRPYLKNTHHKKGLVQWFKAKALSSNTSIAKTKQKNFTPLHEEWKYSFQSDYNFLKTAC
jgi:hypothetical protein